MLAAVWSWLLENAINPCNNNTIAEFVLGARRNDKNGICGAAYYFVSSRMRRGVLTTTAAT
jgi:hypothetical protein